MVKPSEVDDDAAALLTHEIAREIEDQLEYPGQIKVTVIRESRAVESREVSPDEPLLYGELAPWFRPSTAPVDYEDEAELYRTLLVEAVTARPAPCSSWEAAAGTTPRT